MMNRGRTLVGVGLVAVGLVLFLGAGRIFSTFLLEILVGTVAPGAELPPQEFSWGVVTFGNMNAELQRGALGAVLMAVGHLLLAPVAVPPARGGVRAGLFVGFGLMIVAGVLWAGTAWSLFGGLRMIAMTGNASPVLFGEDLPVRNCDVTRFALAAGVVMLGMAGIAGARGKAIAPGRRLMAWFSGLAALGFAGCLMSLALGPLTGVLSGKGMPSPLVLADQMQGAIMLIGFAGASLVLSGGLGIVATALRAGDPGMPVDNGSR